MDKIIESLKAIKEKGLYREMIYLDAAQEPHTVIGGKDVLLLSTNSYLGLCSDDRLKEAVIDAVQKYGVGSGGSRLTTGSYRLHEELENRLAEFKDTESCLIFNTGYMANLGTIAALADQDWVIFCDRLNHASIFDGCWLSGAKLVIYKHCDMEDLERKIQRYRGVYNLIITDGVFSMDGDIAPLPDIVEIAKKYDILTMVDDAHATGVIGPNGGGTSDYFGIKGRIDLQMGTLSKALASEGGYVAGKQYYIDYLVHRAKSFIYSTSLAPHTIAVSLKALDIVYDEPWLREFLLQNVLWFQSELADTGFNVLKTNTPIIPLIIGEADTAVSFSRRLREEGIYIPAIRPPTVPNGTSRLRISLMATHTREDLSFALGKIKEIGQELDLI